MSQTTPTPVEVDTYAREYIKNGGSQAGAWRVTFPTSKAKAHTVHTHASKFHALPAVAARIEEVIRDAAERAENLFNIEADDIVRLWWDIATADPAELTQIQRGACRHCHGLDFEYQWKNEKEFAQAVRNALKSQLPIPEDFGGYGYRETARPEPDCPQCEGQGHARVWMADTRDLSPQARLLYDGVEETRSGVKIKTRDRDGALANLAKWLGMFTENVNLRSPDGSMTPVTQVTRTIIDPAKDGEL